MPKITAPCEYCGTEIEYYPSRPRKFCSQSCLAKHGLEHGFIRKPKTGVEYPCDTCGKIIWRQQNQIKKNVGRFCSVACHDAWQARNSVTRSCALCGKEYRLSPSAANRYQASKLTCSSKCESRMRIKRPLDREHNGKPAVIDSHGYVRIYEPDHPKSTKGGWFFEHRLIVERQLGRYLQADEHVHHLNHERADNRPENLQLLSNSEHMSITVRENSEALRSALDMRQQLAKYIDRFGPLD